MSNQSRKSISQFAFNQSAARNQIILGTLLILIFGALGGVVLNKQNQFFTGLVLKKDLPSGSRVTQDDVTRIQLSGYSLEGVLSQLPAKSFSSGPLIAGELLQASDLGGVKTAEAVVSFEFDASELPVQLRVGDTVQMWQVIPAERANQLGLAEVLEIAETRFDASKKVSLRIPPGLLAAVFIAREELQIVKIS